jgi:hypothetical protein
MPATQATCRCANISGQVLPRGGGSVRGFRHVGATVRMESRLHAPRARGDSDDEGNNDVQGPVPEGAARAFVRSANSASLQRQHAGHKQADRAGPYTHKYAAGDNTGTHCNPDGFDNENCDAGVDTDPRGNRADCNASRRPGEQCNWQWSGRVRLADQRRCGAPTPSPNDDGHRQGRQSLHRRRWP